MSQGGFRWGADTLVYSLVDSLRLWHQVHTFVAFIDIKKAFDSCWVEATLVRLHDVGISGRLWHLLANFLCGTLSQVRLGREGPLTSPVEFAGGQPCHLSPCCHPWCLPCGLGHVPSRVPTLRGRPGLAESQAHLQHALDVVQAWGLRWRFSFLAPPNRRLWSSVLSAAAPIVPCILGTSLSFWCHNTGTSVSLLLPLSLGVLMLTWSTLVVIASSTKLAPDVVAKVCLSLSPHLSSLLTSFPVRHLVLEFVGDDSAALQQLNLSLHRWCRHLLGWPSASLVAAVHWELGIGDALRLALGRAFSLSGRLCAMDHSSSRPPDPASVFRLCSTVQGTWSHWCASLSIPHILATLAILWVPLLRPSDIGSLAKPFPTWTVTCASDLQPWLPTCMACVSMSLLATSSLPPKNPVYSFNRGASGGACSLGSRPLLHRPPLRPSASAFLLLFLP